MDESKGFGRYLNALLEAHRPMLTRIIAENREAWIETDANLWLDLDGPIAFDVPLSAREQFLDRLFSGAREILESHEVLQDITIYVRSFPYRSKSLSRVRTLRYHKENFLNESYVLVKRLEAYANGVGRLYRTDGRYPRIRSALDDFMSLVNQGFADLIQRRGYQVHQERIRDRDHKKLVSLEFAAHQIGDPELEDLYVAQYYRVRSDTESELSNLTQNIGVVLDAYFDLLFQVVFDAQTKIIYPASVPAA